MTRRERRGFTQNRMRFIWKQVKSFFELASDYDEFTELCLSFYYDNASSTVDMDEYRKIVACVGKSRYENTTSKQNGKENTMKTFETGKTYTMRSACDHNCTWTYTVLKRTSKTVTITDGKVTKTCRINKAATEYSGVETVYPLGQYSMAPCLRAG